MKLIDRFKAIFSPPEPPLYLQGRDAIEASPELLERLRAMARHRKRLGHINRRADKMRGNTPKAVVDAYRRLHMAMARGE